MGEGGLNVQHNDANCCQKLESELAAGALACLASRIGGQSQSSCIGVQCQNRHSKLQGVLQLDN